MAPTHRALSWWGKAIGELKGLASRQRDEMPNQMYRNGRCTRLALAALLLGSVCITTTARAQGQAPGSPPGQATQQPLPNMQNIAAAPVPYGQAMQQIFGRAMPAITHPNPGGPRAGGVTALSAPNSCGTTQPDEIVELARALKNDLDLIYEYIYNNIDTTPQYGSLKGPLGTLMDRAGTAFDQADLMIALLQQAGNCTAQWVVGSADLSPAKIFAWLGVDTTTLASQNSLGYILGSGGFPLVNYTNVGGQLGAQIGWAWVQVQIGGGVQYELRSRCEAPHDLQHLHLPSFFS